MEIKTGPYLQIEEQPARNGVQFRYESEGQWLGSIPGVNSTDILPTYPSVRITEYSGSRAMIVVSCVTRDEPFRQHPNHLVGSVHCRNGVYIEILDNYKNVFELKRCGIQFSKRSQVRDRLVLRREMGCDPTNGGFAHLECSRKELHLEAVRLCFQAFIEDEVTGLLTVLLRPILSDPIYDKKTMPSLVIRDISPTCCPISGAKVMLFCNRIDDNDIEVHFYQKNTSGHIVWEENVDLKSAHCLHPNGVISFKAPPFPISTTSRPEMVFIELRRLSVGSLCEPIVFTYLPECPFKRCPINDAINYNVMESKQKHESDERQINFDNLIEQLMNENIENTF